MDGFEINEKVLVYQGPVLYEAKIMKTFDPLTQKINHYDEKKKEFVNIKPDKKFPNKHLTEKAFMVHYQGWNSKWDEWITPSRVLKYNNENLMLMQNIQLEIQQQERLKSEQESKDKLAKNQEKVKNKPKANNKSKRTNNTDATKTIDCLKKIKLKLNGNSIDSIVIDHKNGNSSGKVTKSKGMTNGNSNSKHKHEHVDTEILHNKDRNRNGRKSNNSLIKNENGNGNENENENETENRTGIDVETVNNLHKFSRETISSTSPSTSSSSSSSSSSLSLSSSLLSSSTTTAPIHYESHNGFTHNEIKLLVPDELKIILIDDWENITKNNKLVIIPSEITVSKTIEDFKDYLELEFNDDYEELKVLLELTESIKQYFNQCVGTFLLYRYERVQFNELLNGSGKQGNDNFYDIYHPIFLLRLLSIFPNILMLNEVNSTTIQLSKAYLDILLHWLNFNKEKYLINIEYENQDPWISIMNGS